MAVNGVAKVSEVAEVGVQRSPEEWMKVVGIPVSAGPAAQDGGAVAREGVIDREAVEGYISSWGRSGGAGPGGSENGTRETSAEAVGADAEAPDGDASGVEGVPGGDGEAVAEVTGVEEESVLGVEEEVPTEASGPAEVVESAGEGDGVSDVGEGDEEGLPGDVEPGVIPLVVGEEGELDGGSDGGDGPGLPDLLSDIGEASLEEGDRYGPKPLGKWFRRSEPDGDSR